MLRGLLLLILATFFWGSSFPVIKVVVSEVSSYTYVWVRSALTAAILAAFVAATRGRPRRRAVEGGLAAGIAYALGLWLQGWGTALTTATNSAFITGLNVVFVHLYCAAAMRGYGPSSAASLAAAVAGLYLLTLPHISLNPGDILVLAGAVMWAAQVLIVDAYSGEDPPTLAMFEMLPAVAFAAMDYADGGIDYVPPACMAGIAYLAAACGALAFSLQVAGQRVVRAHAAAIIYLAEPVFAAVISYVALGEVLEPVRMLGAALILLAMAIASLSEEAWKGQA
ncbi:EamA family transporter [Candidatus Geothermarchaeota archaeon ex4572_27]|nr:MAG: EamA family transporter [Candidatus Geothermarchaeota archaeon ex4572_27]